jgi:hypothetical protein
MRTLAEGAPALNISDAVVSKVGDRKSVV